MLATCHANPTHKLLPRSRRRFRRFRCRIGIAAIAVLLMTGTATNAQELSSAQVKSLNSAKSALNSAITNFNLALKTAGPGTAAPKGSKAKLTAIRLQSAIDSAAKAKQSLANLPADNTDVATVATSMKKLETNIALLKARLSGTNTTPAKPKTTPKTKPKSAATNPAPKSATMKLDYRDVEKLKSVRFHLREVEGNVAAINKFVTTAKTVEDQMAIDYRKIQAAAGTLANANRKSGFAQKTLDELPPNGKDVAPAAERLKSAKTQLAAANKYLTPLNKKLMDLINPANYPKFSADYNRIFDLSRRYSNPALIESYPEKVATVLQEEDATQKEIERVVKTYARVIQQQTEQGVKIANVTNGFVDKRAKFLKACAEHSKQLPQLIQGHLDRANMLAEKAVTEKKPFYFTGGGIEQSLGFADSKLVLLNVMDKVKGNQLQKKRDDLQASIAKQAKSLEELIIQQNKLPPELYDGPDKAKVIAAAKKALSRQQPNAQVLTTRVTSEAWKRSKAWVYNRGGTWRLSDVSNIQIKLIVADRSDKTKALILPINVMKDHLAGDTIKATCVYEAKHDFSPNFYLLRSKLK